jgi:AraC-like DNA-binding protein
MAASSDRSVTPSLVARRCGRISFHAGLHEGHDRNTGNPDREPGASAMTETGGVSPHRSMEQAEPLRRALERLRLEGAIFFRAEYTEGWALGSLGGPVIARLLHPGADRVILFDVVASGRCWVALADGERHWAQSGDVIVVPYGDEHTMGGVAPAASVPITTVLTPPPWEQMPIIRHGQGGSRTDVVCGYLYSDDPLFDPGLRALPAAFVVRPPQGPAGRWVEASVTYALEESSGGRSEHLSTRLPELLLIEMLRLHLATAPAVERGWVAALRDPVLAPAMALLHAAPEKKWAVAELAAGAAVSRSVLDARFRQVLGRSPIRYLTEWRMHLAEELLATTEVSVVEIAGRVGYDSEEAFSRAFKRNHARSPSLWRGARSGNRL